MYTNFRSFSSQYSRRLLSILARPIKQKNKIYQFSVATLRYICFLLQQLVLSNEPSKRAKRKKNAEHTHMYTNFRAFLFAIFTSVVVYSRTTKIIPGTSINKRVVFAPLECAPVSIQLVTQLYLTFFSQRCSSIFAKKC